MDPEFSKVLSSAPVKKRPRKRNFKDVEIEAKNGSLGLGHDHGMLSPCSTEQPPHYWCSPHMYWCYPPQYETAAAVLNWCYMGWQPHGPNKWKVFWAIIALTKISIRAKRSISHVFSLLIVPNPFFVHCPHKGGINWAKAPAKAALTSIYGFCHCFLRMEKK